jgi:hypothetical protein
VRMSGHTMNSEEDVKRAIIGAAPEMTHELERLWQKHNVQVYLTEDKAGFSIKAGPYGLVLYDHKAMCQLWIFGFSAQKALHAHIAPLICSQLFEGRYPPESSYANAQSRHLESESLNLIAAVQQLSSMNDMEHFAWPHGVPHPVGKPRDVNGSMVFDLLVMAAAYHFLHELEHVITDCQETGLDKHAEEMRCDQFARDFLLSRIKKYVKTSGEPADWVLVKRAMSIALCSALHLVSTPRIIWHGSASHPSVFKRIWAFVDSITLPENSFFWQYTSCLLLVLIKKEKLKVDVIAANSDKAICLSLLRNLENETMPAHKE